MDSIQPCRLMKEAMVQGNWVSLLAPGLTQALTGATAQECLCMLGELLGREPSFLPTRTPAQLPALGTLGIGPLDPFVTTGPRPTLCSSLPG